MTAVANYHIADHFIDQPGIDADAAYRDAAVFPGALGIYFEDVAGFHDEGFLQRRVAEMIG